MLCFQHWLWSLIAQDLPGQLSACPGGRRLYIQGTLSHKQTCSEEIEITVRDGKKRKPGFREWKHRSRQLMSVRWNEAQANWLHDSHHHKLRPRLSVYCCPKRVGHIWAGLCGDSILQQNDDVYQLLLDTFFHWRRSLLAKCMSSLPL